MHTHTLQNKLLRGFSRQLIIKHHCLKQLSAESELEDGMSLDQASRELDQRIDLEMFLNVACLEPRSIKVRAIFICSLLHGFS